jgi:hypothetical protein
MGLRPALIFSTCQNLKLKIMKYTILLMSLAAFTLTSTADWVLLEDYEDGQFPAGYFNLNIEPDEDTSGGNFIVEDPLDATNKANLILGDTGEISLNNNYNIAVFPLPQEVPEGTTATFYHRHMKGGYQHDVVWGLTGFPPPNPDFGGYYLFEELTVAIQYSSRYNYNARNDTYYMGVDGANARIWPPDLETWYHTWMVIDLASNTYDLYIQGGTYTEQTMVADNMLFKDTALAPGALTNPLTHMFVFAIVGNLTNPRGVDPFYLDDLYLDYSGENLSIPGAAQPPTWLGYPVSEQGWVDTGSWLGWVNVTNDPFVWMDKLGKYTHISGDSGWVYLPK